MILIIGGTSDTHRFVSSLNEDFIISVATEYGYNHFKNLYGNRVILVRFSYDSLKEFLLIHKITKVVDTSHPFAQEISAIASKVCGDVFISYHKGKRSVELPNMHKYEAYEKLVFLTDWVDTANYISDNMTELSPLFFTIGSKNLNHFQPFLKNAIVRVLDDPTSVKICQNLGVKDRNIIAARGPFSLKENVKVIADNSIKCLVSKFSGVNGGIVEKLDAAIMCNINIVLVGLPTA